MYCYDLIHWVSNELWLWYVKLKLLNILQSPSIQRCSHKIWLLFNQLIVGVPKLYLHWRVTIINQIGYNHTPLISVFVDIEVVLASTPFLTPLYFIGQLCSSTSLHIFSMQINFIHSFARILASPVLQCYVIPWDHVQKGSHICGQRNDYSNPFQIWW